MVLPIFMTRMAMKLSKIKEKHGYVLSRINMQMIQNSMRLRKNFRRQSNSEEVKIG